MDSSGIIALVACCATIAVSVMGATWKLSAALSGVVARLGAVEAGVLRLEQTDKQLVAADEKLARRVSSFHGRLIRVEVHTGVNAPTAPVSEEEAA